MPSLIQTVTMRRPSAPSGGGGSEFAFTPTHFVAPYTSVSGAANDDQDMGEVAYNNAQSGGTPTTIGTALRRAIAPHGIGAFPGLYVRTAAQSGGTDTISCFNFVNSGTSHANAIRISGQYCPTKASTPFELKTRLSNGVTTGELGPVTFGMVGKNYHHWYWMYCDEDQSRSQLDSSMASLSGPGCFGGKMIGCQLIGRDGDYAGSNHAGVYFQGGEDMEFGNNIIDGVRMSSGNQNVACFTMFHTRNVRVHHNLMRNGNLVAYVKFDHAALGMYGIDISHNWFEDMTQRGIRLGDPNTGGSTVLNYIRHNVFLRTRNAINPAFANNSGTSPSYWRGYNNTGVDLDCMIQSTEGLQTGAFVDTQWYNNLCHTAFRQFEVQENDTGTAGFFTNGLRMDYNATRSATNWGRTNSSTRATPAAWAAAFSGWDANSVQLGTEPFVNLAGEDFRLQPGHAARTVGNSGGALGGGIAMPVGAYVTGLEEIGLEAAYL